MVTLIGIVLFIICIRVVCLSIKDTLDSIRKSIEDSPEEEKGSK